MSSNDGRDSRGPPRKQRIGDMIGERATPELRRPPVALAEARMRQEAIGQRLRQIFEDVVNEDVPDEFLDLLRRADGVGDDDRGKGS